jgi:hypothetical protein
LGIDLLELLGVHSENDASLDVKFSIGGIRQSIRVAEEGPYQEEKWG